MYHEIFEVLYFPNSTDGSAYHNYFRSSWACSNILHWKGPSASKHITGHEPGQLSWWTTMPGKSYLLTDISAQTMKKWRLIESAINKHQSNEWTDAGSLSKRTSNRQKAWQNGCVSMKINALADAICAGEWETIRKDGRMLHLFSKLLWIKCWKHVFGWIYQEPRSCHQIYPNYFFYTSLKFGISEPFHFVIS